MPYLSRFDWQLVRFRALYSSRSSRRFRALLLTLHVEHDSENLITRPRPKSRHYSSRYVYTPICPVLQSRRPHQKRGRYHLSSCSSYGEAYLIRRCTSHTPEPVFQARLLHNRESASQNVTIRLVFAILSAR